MYHIKKDKRSIQSSEWIYAALVELIKKKKYTDITITELVEKAKLGRSTFYRNFDFLDDILHLKCDEIFDELYLYLMEYYETNRTLDKGKKTIFLKPFLRYWYVHSSIIELLILANRIDIFTESFTKMYMSKLFLPHLNKPHDIIGKHMDYFVAVRSGTLINVLVQWVKNDKDILPDDLADLLVGQMNEALNLNLLL